MAPFAHAMFALRRGVINPFTGKAAYDKTSALICSHVAEGHSRAVLSLSCTNDVLFSGSKGCYAIQ